jgi:4-amino-4-deoxy-L-arabinose transferase-like glycosyltransferase
MLEGNRRRISDPLTRLVPILVIAGLVLLYAIVNWLWLSDNVTSSGWDKPLHLVRSLRYYQAMSPLTLQTLFASIVENPIRPSLFPLTATLVYPLLGATVDSGPMINLLYVAILLSAAYGLGVKLVNRNVGLLAAIVLATYPMVFAMSRLFYLELALAAMVAITLYFLVASDGFKDRTSALLFGLCLGLGLLTKRTFVAFVLVPILYVVLRAGLLTALWRRLTTGPRIHWRAMLVAILGGGALAALWYLPNRETISTLLVLGDSMFVVWWVLSALTIYLIALPSTPETNLLGALSLGATIASVWYLARIEFILRAVGFAFGDHGPAGRTFAWLDPYTYYEYLRRIIVEHISPLHLMFALLAMIVLFVLWLRERPKLSLVWGVLFCWLVGGYAIMTFSLYRQSRAILPLLPPIALLTAAGLLKLPWKRLRIALIAVMLGAGILQFAVLSFSSLHTVAEVTRLGQVGPFAQGMHVLWPDYGRTDPDWWIEDDVLQRMEAARLDQGDEALRLGLLVSVAQVNSPLFQPLLLTRYPHLTVKSLTHSAEHGEPAYPTLFEYDYVAVKRQNANISAEDQAVIDRLLDDPPRAFIQAYQTDKTYALPDGETVYLYRQRYLSPTDLEPTYVSDLAARLVPVVRPGDALLVDTPAMLAPLARLMADLPVYYLDVQTDRDLARITAEHQRIFSVDWAGSPPDGWVWLDQNTHRAWSEWFGDILLVAYGTASGLPEHASGARFGETVVLERYALLDESLEPGDLLPLILVWRAEEASGKRYKVFTHLLAADGQLVAQYDGEPVGGSRPTDEWNVGEVVDDRRGVLLPPDLPSGDYLLVVGLYPAGGGDRLPVVSADGESFGTQLTLGTIHVVAHQP